MNPYTLVRSNLSTPKTLGELAALTGLHVQGVEATIREMGGQVKTTIRKCRKLAHLKVYVLRAKPVSAAEADSRVLLALTQFENLSKGEIVEASKLTQEVVRKALRRLSVAGKISKVEYHMWKRTYNEDAATVNLNKQYEFKTKFVNDRNPWLCVPKNM